MSGLSDATTIDLAAEDAQGEIMVVMVEDRPWTADPVQEAQLREKINLYADFICGGGLVDKFPEAAGKPVRIELSCVQEPIGAVSTLAQYVAGQLHELVLDLL